MVNEYVNICKTEDCVGVHKYLKKHWESGCRQWLLDCFLLPLPYLARLGMVKVAKIIARYARKLGLEEKLNQYVTTLFDICCTSPYYHMVTDPVTGARSYIQNGRLDFFYTIFPARRSSSWMPCLMPSKHRTMESARHAASRAVVSYLYSHHSIIEAILDDTIDLRCIHDPYQKELFEKASADVIRLLPTDPTILKRVIIRLHQYYPYSALYNTLGPYISLGDAQEIIETINRGYNGAADALRTHIDQMDLTMEDRSKIMLSLVKKTFCEDFEKNAIWVKKWFDINEFGDGFYLGDNPYYRDHISYLAANGLDTSRVQLSPKNVCTLCRYWGQPPTYYVMMDIVSKVDPHDLVLVNQYVMYNNPFIIDIYLRKGHKSLPIVYNKTMLSEAINCGLFVLIDECVRNGVWDQRLDRRKYIAYISDVNDDDTMKVKDIISRRRPMRMKAWADIFVTTG